MKKSFQIINFLLAMFIFLSPVLSFASVLNLDEHKTEMSCCTKDSKKSEHGCCHSDKTNADKNKCGDKDCPSNDCHLHQVNVFHIYFPENSAENESEFVFSDKLNSDNTSNLIIKDLSYSFWNPPKYIS